MSIGGEPTLGVLEKNPEKQGLKQHSQRRFVRSEHVLEKNPEKQGLKHDHTVPQDLVPRQF